VQQAKITALAYSTPPKSHRRQSLHRLADQLWKPDSGTMSHTRVGATKKRPEAASDANVVHRAD
jgi:hypothetical protein